MKGKNLSVNESTRIEAYLLSEKAGHPSGMDHYFWKEAEAIVHARTKVVATAVKKAAAAKPKAEAKPKAARKSALSSATGKAQQLSLDGETTAPARKHTLRK